MDARHVNKTKKTLEVERLTWRFDLNRSRSFFTLTLVNFDWPYTHTHTQKKTNLEKCPCTWEKKKTFEKKIYKKKRNKWTCSVFSWCDAQPVSGSRGDREFFYIYYIYIYIYMNISSSSRDRQCWGSVSKPQTADFFFFSPLFLPLTLHLFSLIFFFIFALPPFFSVLQHRNSF